MKSWQTTLIGLIAGLGVLCTELATNLQSLNDISPEAIFSSLGLILIGIFARDNNKSSEDVQIK